VHIAISYNAVIPARTYGGSERIVTWLGRALARRGHRVTYVVPEGSHAEFATVIPYGPEAPALSRLPPDADLVHDFGALSSPPDRPHLFTLQGNVPPGTSLPYNTAFISRNHAERHGGAVYVYNSIDPEEYGPPDWSHSRNHLLFLAMAAWRVKNVRGAIRIARRAGRRLAVVGGHRINLRMGVRITLDPNVRFHGIIGGPQKHRVINHSSALLFPVLWHEPFGIAIVEAMYFGCPVFGTPWGSLPELVPAEAGILSTSEGELVRHLAEVGEFDRRGIHQYAADTFSVDRMTEAYLTLYEQILAGERLHPEAPVAREAAGPLIMDP